jgi:toxin HigB-1
MIKSFRHKGLKVFFETGSIRGINAKHTKRLARMLSYLNRAANPDELDIPGWRLHRLQGEFFGFWSLDGRWQLAHRLSLRRP